MSKNYRNNRPVRPPERYIGAHIPIPLFERVQAVADKEERGKRKWAIVTLLQEALDARDEKDAGSHDTA